MPNAFSIYNIDLAIIIIFETSLKINGWESEFLF